MGFFTKRVMKRDYYDGDYEGTALNVNGKVVAFLAAVGLGFMMFGDGNMDMAGDSGRTRHEREAREIVTEYYDGLYDSLSPAERFTLQFGGETVLRVDRTPGANGILGAFSEANEDFIATYNNGCLESTAYDVNGGEISFSVRGLFNRVSAEGDIPTAAAFVELSSDDSDRIRVASGNTNSIDLEFTGAERGNALVPASEQTQRILDTYGCETGLLSFSLTDTGDIPYGMQSIE